MGRLHKIEPDVDFEVSPHHSHHHNPHHQQHPSNSPNSCSSYSCVYAGTQCYDNYGKEYFIGKYFFVYILISIKN